MILVDLTYQKDTIGAQIRCICPFSLKVGQQDFPDETY